MPYSPILVGHIGAGTLGFFSGATAMIFRKGHVWAGRVFVAAMLTMAVAAVYLAFEKHQPNNVGGGFIAFYLIGTGWLTARRRDGETIGFARFGLLIPMTIGILSWVNGVRVLRSGATSQDGVPVGMTFFMGSVCLLAAIGDVRMLLKRGVLGAKRVARHLWRMCFGLFIAAGSFFFGPSNRPLRLVSALGINQHTPTSSADFLALPGPLHKFCEHHSYSIALVSKLGVGCAGRPSLFTSDRPRRIA